MIMMMIIVVIISDVHLLYENSIYDSMQCRYVESLLFISFFCIYSKGTLRPLKEFK